MSLSGKIYNRGGSLVFLALGLGVSLHAQTTPFHNAPASAQKRLNPYAGQAEAADAGRDLFAGNCALCHGINGQGAEKVPGLAGGATQKARDGELYWYITHGDESNGMPSWNSLAERQRWQLVSYIKSLKTLPAMAIATTNSSTSIKEPPPTAPFTDFRYESPGKIRKITVNDLPQPYASDSSSNGPKIVQRPTNAWPQAPAGFKVELYADKLDQPRLIRTAPNGDYFTAETRSGKLVLLRGITAAGKPEQVSEFATGLTQPFGIAFYPPGPKPEWLYVGDTDAVMRIPYGNGDLQARGAPQHVADLPHGSGHSTRDIQFSPDGKTMFVSVGSGSNVDDPDTKPSEHNRADILAFNPDGSDMRVYASGIRNAVGLAINPQTGELWCSVNERDGLGDNLVPDYITHVTEGGFYGWPWWYSGAHQDPRLAGKHPELKDKVIVPDVLLQPHSASLQMTFYQAKQFPAEYAGDAFASEHGSWNKSIRAGYEVIRIPMHQTGHASGEYQDFLTGFVLDNGDVWGRPVGVTVAGDGSLLVTDDASSSIWRVRYVGTQANARRP
jgi:glucose/arabinose dehydrogenase/cytochrome c5